MRSFDVIIVTPPGLSDPSLAIAACRAGGRGFLNLEYASDVPTALAALERLERFTSSNFGIKLGSNSELILERVLAHPFPRLAWIWLAGGAHPELERSIKLCRERSVEILWEAVSLPEALHGHDMDVDGLVLKGQEAGGRIGADSTFILLQKWLRTRTEPVADEAVPPRSRELPFWVQGGVGLNTAAACAVAGAAGVVLDAQVLLTQESTVSAAARRHLKLLDGSETVSLGERLGEGYRVFARPGLTAVEELSQLEQRLIESDLLTEERLQRWRQAIRTRVGADAENGLWLIGQDAALAARFAERWGTVAATIRALKDHVEQQIETARRLNSLAEGSPLAVRHGTRYPIVQGPMTRVSDTAAFADAVAAAGGLPFLALALMRRTEVENLLRETKTRLGERPWGAGILGFAPPEIRHEQLEAIRAIRPPFALIAGGRPDQARELEKEGIPTYLHVPSPGLLKMFLRDGARCFIFEGRECGGHVGPRSSFVLWETMCDVLLEHIGPNGRGDDLHILFAGGIHDGLSAALVATLGAGLADRGVAIGVLLGTAYLFTEEAVAGGAIVPQFQQQALGCDQTVLLETGPGHAIRCVPTPYFEAFEQEKRRLRSEGRSADEIREALEAMNIGRLRIASKGIDRAAPPDGERAAAFVSMSEEEQHNRGMYMIGQVAALRDRVTTMARLHEDVSAGSTRWLQGHTARIEVKETREQPCDVAIIGMACVFPRAADLLTYWENVLNRVDAITEVPADHWDWRLYYDPNPKARDKICSKWGGFLDDMAFDPLVYGMPPNSLTSIEPTQLFLLETVRRALIDAGYAERPFDRDRTAVVLGAGGGAAQLSMYYSFRAYLRMLDTVPGLADVSTDILKKCAGRLPELTEDSFPGILLNVAAGRVANRFNFGGPNFSIDAACGSSLAALYAAVRELEMGTSDTVVLMGADTVQNPFTFQLFSKTQAFSARGRCSTFDEAADGIVISEGIATVILKRLADAERDGDHIYAVIKGVGASSDGKDKGLTAPRPEGQLRALRRAYQKAGVSPARLGYVEAHGTGTVLGDQTEVQALGQVFREAGAPLQTCAIGSVKSMIGHTKCAAGLAGLINATLALHHKVLPPLLVHTPNSRANFEQSPFFLNAEARPWIHGGDWQTPRCAGVSAFGFGGTNFHAVLEEYTGDYLDRPTSALQHWPVELLVWQKPNRASLIEAVESLQNALHHGACPSLTDLAYSLWLQATDQVGECRLAIVAAALDDLKEKLGHVLKVLRSTSSEANCHDPRGIFVSIQAQETTGKIAFLFPGQGSQYPNMLAQLALAFPEVRRAFDDAERTLFDQFDRPLGKLIFPPSAFRPEQEQESRRALMCTDVAQPAIGAASLGMFHLLSRLGIKPDFLAGHSYGDYVALCAAGALTEADLVRLSHQRGRVIVEATDRISGGMAAIEAGCEAVTGVLKGLEGVIAANLNAPNQTVISGTNEGIQTALTYFQAQGIRGQRLPVACAFHSPLVAAAREPFARALAACPFSTPRQPVYANATATPYPNDPALLTATLAEHLTSPVRFQEEIEALYEAGARIFIEVGPQGVLTGLVGSILADRPHVAVASDQKGRPGLVQLQYLLGQLLVSGIAVRLDRLYEGREPRVLDLARLENETGKVQHSPSTWLVNSIRVRPLNGPEPGLLGQARPAIPTPETKPDLSTDREPKPAAAPIRPAPVSKTAEKKVPSVPASNGHPASHSNGHVPIPSSVAGTDEAAQMMARFQDLMARFLETQRSVMVSYLQGNSATLPLPPAELSLPTIDTSGRVAPTPTADEAPELAEPNFVQQTDELAQQPPSTPPEKAAAPPAPKSVGTERETMTARLLDIVRQRTGYPPEMLGLDMDLEADLGIDSIKRVEILGSLADDNGTGLLINQQMEKLTGLKTLRCIIECLTPTDANPANGTTKHHQNGHENGTKLTASRDDPRAGIQRMLVKAIDAALPDPAIPTLPTGAIIITDDGHGIAYDLAQRLRDQDRTCVVIRMATAAPARIESDVFVADLTSPETVEVLLRQVRQQVGPVAGLIHLLPLAQSPADESDIARMRREVKSLFLLARGLADELCSGARSGHALLLAATAKDAGPDGFFPGSGGVGGVVKSLAHEWPEVLVRVVELDVSATHVDSPSETAEQLLAELNDPDGPIEIGYEGDTRKTWTCVPAPLDTSRAPEMSLGPETTILLTGGARGITASVAEELARRYQPNLILIGRSPLPEADEPAETRSLTMAAELKAALMARWKREGRPVTPAMIETAYHRLLQDREIRANLTRLTEAGARVHYYQADVRDEHAFVRVLDEVDRRFGGIDGVIHGAGVIQDKLIRDKTPESYERVFGTKVESALILSRHLRPERLKFCVFFASVAGRFGNRGQTDYAAANEVLSKLAVYLDRRWAGRVVSVVWGPWSGIGMVSELEEHLGQRGLQMIPPTVGPLFMEEELRHGRKGECEVVIAGEVGQLALRRPGTAVRAHS